MRLPPDVLAWGGGASRARPLPAAPGAAPTAPVLVRLPPEVFPPLGAVEFELHDLETELAPQQTSTPATLTLQLPPATIGIVRWVGNESSNRSITTWSLELNKARVPGYGPFSFSLGLIERPGDTFIRLTPGALWTVTLQNIGVAPGDGTVLVSTRVKGWYWTGSWEDGR